MARPAVEKQRSNAQDNRRETPKAGIFASEWSYSMLKKEKGTDSVLHALLCSSKGAVAKGMMTCLFIIAAIIIGFAVIGLVFKLIGILISLAVVVVFIVGLVVVLRWLGKKTIE